MILISIFTFLTGTSCFLLIRAKADLGVTGKGVKGGKVKFS